MRQSKVLNKLRGGQYVLSTQIGSAYAPFAAIAGQVGFDCVWLDMEHKAVSEEQIRECILACSTYDCDTVVRIRKRGYVDYFRPLEDGATGIMVPHCKSVEEAELSVYNTKFHPIGRRGMDFTGLASDYMASPIDKCIENAIKNTFTMVQIEDIEGLTCVEEIAATDGIDLLFVGPGDLKQSAKAFGVFSDTFMDEVYERVNAATNATKDTWWGTVTGSAAAAKDLYDKGCRFINVRGDFGAVFSGLSLLNNDTRDLINK